MKSLLLCSLLSLASAFVHPTKRFHCFDYQYHHDLKSTLQESSSFETTSNSIASSFEQLCIRVGVQPRSLLRLDESESEIRGLYLNHAVNSGDIILSIPLSKCLRDDQQLPDWMPPCEADFQKSAWALRLAACLVEAQQSPKQSHHALWFSLFPNSTSLKASLPVHWDDDTIQSTAHTAFITAVDSAYFARANLMQAIDDTPIDLNAALDLVQTRACRVETSKGGSLRLLAPVFDFINHANDASAVFALENDQDLVVRAVAHLHKDEQVCIHYGPSTQPAWQSLVSYGFIAAAGNDEEERAEVYLDGARFEVGPDFIPEDMIRAESCARSSQPAAINNQISPEIAVSLAHRLANVASTQYLHVQNDAGGEKEATPERIISLRLASSLRQNQYRIITKCSLNLLDWAAQQ